MSIIKVSITHSVDPAIQLETIFISKAEFNYNSWCGLQPTANWLHERPTVWWHSLAVNPGSEATQRHPTNYQFSFASHWGRDNEAITKKKMHRINKLSEENWPTIASRQYYSHTHTHTHHQSIGFADLLTQLTCAVAAWCKWSCNNILHEGGFCLVSISVHFTNQLKWFTLSVSGANVRQLSVCVWKKSPRWLSAIIKTFLFHWPATLECIINHSWQVNW